MEQRVFYSNIFQQLRILRQVRKNLWKITSTDWQWLTDMGKLLPWENPLFTLTYIERCINFDIILSQKHIYNEISSWNYMQLIRFFVFLSVFLCNLVLSKESNKMLLHTFHLCSGMDFVIAIICLERNILLHLFGAGFLIF